MFRSSSGGGQKTPLGRLTACKDEGKDKKDTKTQRHKDTVICLQRRGAKTKRHKDTVNYLQRRGEHWTQRQSGGVPSSELTVT